MCPRRCTAADDFSLRIGFGLLFRLFWSVVLLPALPGYACVSACPAGNLRCSRLSDCASGVLAVGDGRVPESPGRDALLPAMPGLKVRPVRLPVVATSGFCRGSVAVFRQSFDISSRVLPLVSGTHFQTKSADASAIRA